MKLSIIDQSPIPEGSSPTTALHNTIALARLADRLGYERYWIAEHHGMRSLASPAPEILITRVAAETSGIRVGSGGVMLPHYAPLKVAETFRMLHALYPDRIDLGLGRAPGGTPLETMALGRFRERAESDDFPQQLGELLAFLGRYKFPEGHPFARIFVAPETPGGPTVWMLGSSPWSASAAAQLSLPYAFAHFISPEPTRWAIEHYRSTFVSTEGMAAPHAILALGVICADTTEEAERLARSTRLMYRRLRQGDLRPVPTPEAALAELGPGPYPEPDPNAEWPRIVVGDAATVHARLTQIVEALAIDELMIVTITHDHQARLHSYELLAEAFGLTPRA